MAPELSVETLAARIARVERLNRALCCVVALALVIGGAALTVAHFSQPNTIPAARFAVLNATILNATMLKATMLDARSDG